MHRGRSQTRSGALPRTPPGRRRSSHPRPTGGPVGRAPGRLNARVGGRALQGICALTPEVRARAVALADAEHLSGRGTDRLLRVARTIADLDGAARGGVQHVDEAARWRSPAARSPLAPAG